MREFFSKDYVKEMRQIHEKERADDQAQIESLKLQVKTINEEFQKNKQMTQQLQNKVEED